MNTTGRIVPLSEARTERASDTHRDPLVRARIGTSGAPIGRTAGVCARVSAWRIVG
jgi:hypothetical protein